MRVGERVVAYADLKQGMRVDGQMRSPDRLQQKAAVPSEEGKIMEVSKVVTTGDEMRERGGFSF